MRVLSLCIILLLQGCAITVARQCAVGVMLVGPLPVPTASCDLIFEPAEDEGDD